MLTFRGIYIVENFNTLSTVEIRDLASYMKPADIQSMLEHFQVFENVRNEKLNEIKNFE